MGQKKKKKTHKTKTKTKKWAKDLLTDTSSERYTDGTQAYKKMFHIMSHQGNVN